MADTTGNTDETDEAGAPAHGGGMAPPPGRFPPGYDATRTALYKPCAGAGSLAGVMSELLQHAAPALCAHMARLAYCPTERIDSMLREGGFAHITHFADAATSTQAFLAVSTASKTAVLAFRGTQADDPSDVITDIKASHRAWPQGGRVHRGFAQAFDAVWPAVETAIRAAMGATTGAATGAATGGATAAAISDAAPDCVLLLTGHSLGAALATLAASRLGHGRLVTFGSPRVGDAAFVATLAGISAQRFVNCCDMVCDVPPEMLGYRHAGAPAYLDRLGRFQPGWSAAEIAQDRSRAWAEYLAHLAWRPGMVAVRQLADHAPINYVNSVAAIRSASSAGA